MITTQVCIVLHPIRFCFKVRMQQLLSMRCFDRSRHDVKCQIVPKDLNVAHLTKVYILKGRSLSEVSLIPSRLQFHTRICITESVREVFQLQIRCTPVTVIAHMIINLRSTTFENFQRQFVNHDVMQCTRRKVRFKCTFGSAASDGRSWTRRKHAGSMKLLICSPV